MVALRAVAILLLVLLSGCISARRGVQGDIVRSIRFYGNGDPYAAFMDGTTDLQLRSQLEQGTTGYLIHVPFSGVRVDLLGIPPLVKDPARLDAEALRRDAYRLEVWYAHRGFFDARVLGWEVREVLPLELTRRERKLTRRAKGEGGRAERATRRLDKHRDRLYARRKARVVDVVGFVEPGPRTIVRHFPFEGLDELRVAGGLVRTVRRTGEMREGFPFNLQYTYLTRERLLDTLRDHAYAYAHAAVEVNAYPTGIPDVCTDDPDDPCCDRPCADLTLHVTPGPTARFGEITITGLDRVPERIVRESLGFAEGERYKISVLRDAQRRLFALGVFAVVSVDADLADPTRESVPVKVSLTESTFGVFRLGGGLTYTGTDIQPRLSTFIAHLDTFGKLVRTELDAGGGLSVPLSRDAPHDGFPVFDTSLRLIHPRVFTPRLSAAAEISIVQDLQGGQLPFRNPKAIASLAWKVSERTTLRTSAGFEHFTYLNLTGAALRAARATFGDDYENPYQLATVDVRLTYDSRDDPLSPRRGTFTEVQLRQAVPFLVGDYAYTDISGDYRRFFKRARSRPKDPTFLQRVSAFLLNRRVLAIRGHGRLLQAWGDSSVPYPERAFLGGGTSLRGFRPDQVGPYDCLCTYVPDEGDPFTGLPGEGQRVEHRYLPHGGLLSAGGSVELRHPFFISGAQLVLPFVDVGLLANTVSELSPDLFRWGVGLGGRYDTLAGPVRFDLAFRPLYPEDTQADGGIGCMVGDGLGRPVDWLSNRKNRADPSLRPNFVMIGYIAIGESF